MTTMGTVSLVATACLTAPVLLGGLHRDAGGSGSGSHAGQADGRRLLV